MFNVKNIHMCYGFQTGHEYPVGEEKNLGYCKRLLENTQQELQATKQGESFFCCF